MKTTRCCYLYADGHAVIVYEKQDRELGRGQYVEVHERWTDARLDFTGRLILSEALMVLAKQVRTIRAKAPAIEHGSTKLKTMGIAVGVLTFELTDWSRALYWHDIPGLLGGDYHYQPDVVEAFDPAAEEWASHRVARIHRAKVATIPQEIAA